MPQWPKASSNSILVSGVPLEFEFEAYENDIWPGMGVNIVVGVPEEAEMCGDGDNVTCIVDISMASLTGRGSWRKDGAKGYAAESTSYALDDGDMFKCISGPITVMLLLAISETITEGEKLQCVGSGVFGAYICGNTTSDPCALVAEALQAVTTTSGEVSTYIHAKLLI